MAQRSAAPGSLAASASSGSGSSSAGPTCTSRRASCESGSRHSALPGQTLISCDPLSCLFDLLDVVTTVPPDPFKEVALVASPPLAFTTVFLMSPLGILLRNSDHALTLCKCISYVFQHWDALTADSVDRSALLDLLLDQVVFDRLALFWSQSVRSYVVRLIVFRLSHINQRAGGPTAAEVHMVATLNVRLERIRRRHADLEPSVLGSILEDDSASSLAPPPSPGLKRSRSTIAMVRLPSEPSSLSDEFAPTSEADRAQRPGAEVITGGGSSSAGAVGKATQWFKKSFGGGSGGKKKRGSADDLSSQASAKTLAGIAEDTSEGTASPISPTTSLPPRSPSATRTQHPPLFSVLPSPVRPDVPSPARSSFESSGLPSPADFFFSEAEERKLVASDAYQPSALALAGPSLPRNNPFINAALQPGPDSPTSSLASYTFGSRGSVDSSYSSSGTVTPTTSAGQSPGNTTGVFTFGFAQSPLSDSFEINASSPTVPTIVLPPGQGPSPGPLSPTSNRMSRSFSRRSTLLTPLASHILEDLANAGEEPSRIAAAFAAQKEKDAGYDRKLHPYAVQFLAELELTMEEYAEFVVDSSLARVSPRMRRQLTDQPLLSFCRWYGPSGAGTLSADGAPPRLSVGWCVLRLPTLAEDREMLTSPFPFLALAGPSTTLMTEAVPPSTCISTPAPPLRRLPVLFPDCITASPLSHTCLSRPLHCAARLPPCSICDRAMHAPLASTPTFYLHGLSHSR